MVQVKAGPIKETYDHLREVLAFLGEPKVKQKLHNNTLIYRFMSSSEPSLPMRVKVEINCKEHFSVLPMQTVPFRVENDWFSGHCDILSYQFDELIGTKLRALYQRRKGRDLFDLYKALTTTDVDDNKVVESYLKYMDFVVDHIPTYKEFVANMDEKMRDDEFLGDTTDLLREEKFSTLTKHTRLSRNVWLINCRSRNNERIKSTEVITYKFIEDFQDFFVTLLRSFEWRLRCAFISIFCTAFTCIF